MTVALGESQPLLDALADGVIITGRAGRVAYANRAAEKLFAWGRGELVGQPLTVLMPPRMHPLHQSGFNRYMATGEQRIMGRPVRVAAQRKDGGEFEVELTLSTFPGPANEKLVVAAIRDLGDRIALERSAAVQTRLAAHNAVIAAFVAANTVEDAAGEALRAIGENLRWVVGNFWVRSGDELRCIASWQAAEVDASRFIARSTETGLREGEGLPGRAWRDRHPAWSEDVVLEGNFPRAPFAREAGLHGAFAFPVIVEGSTYAVFEFFRVSPQVVDEELLGAVTALGAQVGQSIERMRAQARQREAMVLADAARLEAERAESRARFLAEASAVLSSSLDYEQTLRRVAELAVPAVADWCTVVAVDERGVLRRVAVAHRDPAKADLVREYQAHFPPALHRAGSLLSAAAGKPILQAVVSDADLAAAAQGPEHLRILRGMGCSSCVMVPMILRGEPAGVISLMNGPGRPPFDDGDARLAGDLAQRAAMAVENARLYRKAQDAVRLRDDFLSVASHELRTPLTSLSLQVAMLIRMLARADANPPTAHAVREKAAILDRQVRRLKKLVDHLLDVSRASAGVLHLELEDVDLAALIREIAATFEEDVAAAGCQLKLDLQEGIAGRWDRLRLAQVISNFLTNAVKYGAGGVVAIRTRAEGGKAVVAVRDHGIGIAEQDLDRIFGRFERAVPAGHYAGLGLGLWIVRVLTDAMGAKVAVHSEPGKGSTFSLELEMAPAAPALPDGSS
ncbi:MAG: GAF domain-containing protein [Myxococcales bacterium]|nr:GAF domain-containing protein [Myxococcales bacterium]